MRLATIQTQARTQAVRVEGDELVLLRAADVGEVLAAADRDRAANDETGDSVPIWSADFAPLVPHPGKIFCVGLNYRSHILEGGFEVPAFPTLFAKFEETLIGARDDIVLPAVSKMVDWEVELAAVIGEPLRHVGIEEARRGIAGYTIANDISARDYQTRTSQLLQGKTFESTTPVGPFLVTGDEIDDAVDLEIMCQVDGQCMQHDRTSELVFSGPHVTSYISEIITLQPGDLILLGTTGGVGFARNPPEFLKPGQVVRCAIEGLGECLNRCRAEDLAGQGNVSTETGYGS